MAFLEREQAYVRTFYPAFEWVRCVSASARNRLRVPLEQARVSLVSTAGAYAGGQSRFADGDDGDASFREVAWNAPVRFSHVGYDTARAYRDPEVVFPRRTLDGLVHDRIIGGVSQRVFSCMGYIPNPDLLINETAPRVATQLVADAVDLVLLVPA